jgi:hypothetical protein
MLQHGNRIRHERGNDYVSELEAAQSRRRAVAEKAHVWRRTRQAWQGGQSQRGRRRSG